MAVPLVVMSVHLYQFFETDHWLVRLALSASFDVLVVALFYFLKDEHIKKNKTALKMTWSALFVLIGFQVYVNVWAYWELNWFRALVSGSIFPVLVGMISYIGMMREERVEKAVQVKSKQKERALSVQSARNSENSETERALSVPKTVKAVENTSRLASKEAVIAAVKSGRGIEEFRGCSNWRSVKRWAEHNGRNL